MNTAFMLLPAMLLSAASGIAAAVALLPLRRGDGRAAATIVLGILLGAWLSSGSFLAVLMIGGPSLMMALLIDSVLVLAMVGLFAAARRWHVADPTKLLEQPPRPRSSLLWLAPLLIAGWMALQTSWSFAAAYPHGWWDAWANWNLKARFFALGGERWFDVYDPLMNAHWHDYPLWLPLSLARLWTYLGSAEPWVGQCLSVGVMAMVAAVLFTGLRAMRGMMHACVATIVLLTSLNLLYWGGGQYADIPLGMFMLGSLVALSLGLSDTRHPPAWWLMAGLLAGAAVCTKHEGKLFCLALTLTAGLATWRVLGLKPASQRIGVMLLAMVPGVAITMGFNMLIEAHGQQFFGASTWPMLTDPARHRLALREIIRITPRVFDWRVLCLLAVYAGAAGLNRHRGQRTASVMCLATALLLTAGYYVTLITTHLNLSVHVTSSTDRLLIQLWPLLLLGIFLLLRASGEMKSAPAPTAEGRAGDGQP